MKSEKVYFRKYMRRRRKVFRIAVYSKEIVRFNELLHLIQKTRKVTIGQLVYGILISSEPFREAQRFLDKQRGN